MPASWDDMALVGHVARPHGIRGDMIVNPATDFPEERFAPGSELFVKRGQHVERVTVTRARMQQGRPVIGLTGVNDMNGALEYAGLEFRVPVGQLSTLPAGVFYRHDLIGCQVVTAGGSVVGLVRDVEGTMGGSRLVLQTDGGAEVLIPLADDICVSIAPADRRIVIDPPEGLLDLNVTGQRARRRPERREPS
jgi:16S rRNA processing protein RimM